ncbi:hypothetical protein GF325_13815 [Candidatus Bathyarchaeota archaeon]|nr:hypothetical protein [Candidatus Bathyarchaeota archaeon]
MKGRLEPDTPAITNFSTFFFMVYVALFKHTSNYKNEMHLGHSYQGEIRWEYRYFKPFFELDGRVTKLKRYQFRVDGIVHATVTAFKEPAGTSVFLYEEPHSGVFFYTRDDAIFAHARKGKHQIFHVMELLGQGKEDR